MRLTFPLLAIILYALVAVDSSAARYPVVYHLHSIGGDQDSQQNTSSQRAFESAHAQGLIGKVIIVLPNAYTDAF
ncbi:MAG: hypothetical protein IT433_10380 [Phycisphaerales bacterium]|nr:hypothetical protein [Phycisphaerales bacterium]